MRYILVILIFLSSCKCEYHLKKAYKEGCLNDVTYSDTVVSYDTITFDTTLYFYAERDSVRFVDSVKCIDGEPVLIGGSKSSNRASVDVKLNNGVLTVDATCEALRDSVRVLKEEIIDSKRIVTNVREINSDLTQALRGEIEASNKKSRSMLIFGIAAVLFGLGYFVRKFL